VRDEGSEKRRGKGRHTITGDRLRTGRRDEDKRGAKRRGKRRAAWSGKVEVTGVLNSG
jgi:hypothetical protein